MFLKFILVLGDDPIFVLHMNRSTIIENIV